MVSALYASLASVLIVWLSAKVILARRNARVLVGDGGNKPLLIARSAQGNALDYLPVFLLLLFAFEFNGGPLWLVHLLGILMLVARALHAYAMFSSKLKMRVTSIIITFSTIVILAIANIFYLPFADFL